MTDFIDDCHIKTWPTETCLISELVSYLSELPREELADYIVILPTLRLNTFVRASLAKHFGSLIPPTLTTLEQLVKEQSRQTRQIWQTYSSTEVELILHDLIKKNSYIHLRPGHERELALLFEELVTNQINERGFSSLEETIRQDIYRTQEQLGSLHDRCLEIKGLWEQFAATLTRKTRYTSAGALSSQCQAVLRHWDELDIAQRPVLMVAFTSISPSLLPLAQKIAKNNGKLWFHSPPKLLTKVNPLANLLKEFEVDGSQDLIVTRSPASVNSAPNAYTEVQVVIEDIKSLLSHGVAPSKIAILVTNESTYAKYLRLLQRQLPTNSNIALSIPISQTPIGSWVHAFTQIFTTHESAHSILSWLSHPITLGWVQQELRECNATEAAEESAQRISDKYIYQNLSEMAKGCQTPQEKDLWRLVLNTLAPFRKRSQKPLKQWIATWQELTSHFQPIIKSQSTDQSLQRAALTGFDQFLTEMALFTDQLSLSMNPVSFCHWLNTHLLKREVRSTGEPLAGIQIISLPEARSFPFQNVFMLGCNEGSFPKSLPKDELLDDFLKRRMSLPGWQALEAREDLTFQLLLARIPQLHMYYSESKYHEPLVRSRFIEQVLAYTPIEVNRRNLPTRNNSPDTASERSLEGAYNELPESILNDYSATSLEMLIHCPYRFLLSKLKVKELAIPGLEPDPRAEGEWLHVVLERFFDRWPKDLSPEQFESFVTRRLVALTKEHGPKGIEQASLFMHLKDFAWPRYASYLKGIISSHGFESAPDTLREHRFCYQRELGGKETTLRGSIDFVQSVKKPQQAQLIIDYKRKGLPAKKSIRSGTSPQLAVYAGARSIDDDTIADNIIVGYWSILSATWQLAAVGSEAIEAAKTLGLATTRNQPLDHYRAKVDELWSWRLDQITKQDGRFRADPSDCHFCNYQNICRRDDPRHQERIRGQDDLAQRTEASR